MPLKLIWVGFHSMFIVFKWVKASFLWVKASFLFQSNRDLYFHVTRAISFSFLACMSLLLSTLSTTPY